MPLPLVLAVAGAGVVTSKFFVAAYVMPLALIFSGFTILLITKEDSRVSNRHSDVDPP